MVPGRLVDLFDFHKYVQGQGRYKKVCVCVSVSVTVCVCVYVYVCACMCDVCLTLLHMCEPSLTSQQITESRKWTYTARTLYPDLTYNHMLRAGYLLRNYYLK